MKETYRKIRKVLIANRGEIAARIQRTLHAIGIQSVVVFADDDADFQYIGKAAIAESLGHGNLHETYLNQEKLIEIALKTNVDAIHPGYGFLSENDVFAQKVMDAGIVWVGPEPAHIRLMGNKINARSFAKKIGIPVVEIWEGKATHLKNDSSITFPVIAKPANGGGGKGMRLINDKTEIEDFLERTSAEAERYFGDGTVYLEKYIPKARHIEVQILADSYGNAVHLFERECTVQRRYQKIIEEAPAANLSQKTKEKLHQASILLVKETGYKNAGTVEFIVDEQEQFYFLEMNTRIQVEHPVTEEITGIDLIEKQIEVAEGKQLSVRQSEISENGHAIEVRLYAEDPSNNFIPSAGTLHAFRIPAKNVRIEAAGHEGSQISTSYDPMLAKLIVKGKNRQLAINKLLNVVEKTVVHGVETNIPLLSLVLNDAEFKAGNIHTTWCDEISSTRLVKQPPLKTTMAELITGYVLAKTCIETVEVVHNKPNTLWQSIGYWRNFCRMYVHVENEDYFIRWRKVDEQNLLLHIGDTKFEINYVYLNNRQYKIKLNNTWKWLYTSVVNNKEFYISCSDRTVKVSENLKSYKTAKTKSEVNGLHSSIVSPLPGKVIKIHTPEGTHVKKGDALLIIESMKMENKVVAVSDSTIKKVCVVEGQQLEGSEVLLELEHKTCSN